MKAWIDRISADTDHCAKLWQSRSSSALEREILGCSSELYCGKSGEEIE
jgi:hypothetical protein